MDFKRIEWIFFLVFLGVNIFLFSIYREGLQDESNVSYSDRTESLEKRLEKENIEHKGTFSTNQIEGYYLSGEKSNFYEVIQQKRIDQGDNNLFRYNTDIIENGMIRYPSSNYYIDPKNVETTLSEFLANPENVLYGNEYAYLPQFSNLTGDFPEVTVSQVYEGIAFRDDSAEISLSLEKHETDELFKIVNYTQYHVENLEKLREKSTLYTEREAVETLYINSKIPSNSTITFSKLAYSCIYQIREKNVYVPVWFIGISSNEKTLQIEQVNAMSNTIITNNTVTRVENHG
ncbi:two-component system regulatory protein YycI [Enterococcus sp. BWR-S5]|uniref:two-component system regulatory protein YycI n=1 Tax=Enterococcus sp. BWR-S5 TaxID=2787714 RepID=UPI001924F72D|nr:two-component system regulatory protein YycI [Enterococcus sp. BWR-S5]MBL1227011.1 two-component system regulatory protein YycI [Enterococcus sp. BWR-S5]